MTYLRYVAMVCLAAMAAPCLFAQGLTTTATKDDWEEINFEFNSSVLTDGYPSLLKLADLLKAHPDYKVKLEGHTDQIGSEAYNKGLAQKRANTVRDFLAKYGAGAGQVTTVAMGKANPKVPSREANARFMNRRVYMTVTDGAGKVISAGGIGDALNAMGGMSKKCCDDILRRLDKLDEMADLLRRLAADNDALKRELADIKKSQADLDSYVRGLKFPAGPEGPAAAAAQPTPAVAPVPAAPTPLSPLPSSSLLRYSSVNFNAGADTYGDLTVSGRGRLFIPFWERSAVQFQGEYMYFRDRQEGQFDFGVVNRFSRHGQAGAFGSFKYVSLSNRAKDRLIPDVRAGEFTSVLSGTQLTSAQTSGFDPNMPMGSGLLGQASGVVDYIFSRGRVGIFASKGFLNEAVIGRTALSQNVYNEFYIRSIDQAGVSTTLALFGPAYLEANIGALRSYGYSNKAGGSARFIYPFKDHVAFTLEGGLNETVVTRDNWGRVVAGVQFGNFMRPKDYMNDSGGGLQAVPADIPRVRYELLARRVRTGNGAPIADAGPDQIGVAAGTVTLNGSGSFDPEGDPITFQWSQVAGPAVSLSGANAAIATFAATEGQSYAFRLAVTDDRGAQGIARTAVTTEKPEVPKIIRFQASPSSIKAGDASILDWQVIGADTVTITELGSVPLNGSREVKPAQTTTYKLTAKNRAGEVGATTTIVVESQPRPSFTSCQVQPTNITPGETATISWSTQNATAVSIAPGIGNVELSGSRMVSPTTTTTYTITASGAETFAPVTCTVTVNVSAQGTGPRILRFSANPSTINAGEKSTLLWTVENADKVTISELGDVNLADTRDVTPAKTTTYTLTATNKTGNTTASVTITVNAVTPPVPKDPSLKSCQANPATLLKPGDPAQLSWVIENANRLTIVPFNGEPILNGPVTVNPTATTTYVLTATGLPGTKPATCSIVVTVPGAPEPPIVVNPQEIETIYRELIIDADQSISPGGGGLTYIWEPIGTGAAVLDQGQPQTRVQLGSLYGDYMFKLTVRNAAGQQGTGIVTVHYRSARPF